MAQEVAIPGTDKNAKICNVVGVAFLCLVPFYNWIWWYRAITGQTPINGWLSVVLYFVFSPAWIAYMQSGANTVWENTGSSAAPVAPAATITEAAPAAEVADTTTEPAGDQPSA